MKSKTCLLAVVLALVEVAAATNKKLAPDPQNQRAGFAVWGGFAPWGSNSSNGPCAVWGGNSIVSDNLPSWETLIHGDK